MNLRFRPGQPIVTKGRLWGSGGDVQIRLLLDTGASRTLVSPRRLREVGIEALDSPKDFAMSTVGGIVLAPVVPVLSLGVLGAIRPSFEVVAHALPPSAPFDGLLGLDFLVGFRLTLDMRAGELAVEP